MLNIREPDRKLGVSFAIALAIAMVISVIISGCGSDSGSGVTELNSKLITPDKGGSLSFGQVHVSFPPGSTDSLLTVSGEIVSLEVMPENIKPLTEVHKIGLSDPDQYNAGTAILKFTLDRNVDDANIYHSKDGVNWENLSGDVDGNTTSSKINGFSYFLAATPGGVKDSSLYRVTFINNTTQSGDVCLFQIPAPPHSFGYSTAWMKRYLHPNSTAVFSWGHGLFFLLGPYRVLTTGINVFYGGDP